MKKNLILSVLAALLLFTAGLSLFYRSRCIELADTCFDLRDKPLFDYFEEEERQREIRKSVLYNYLCDEDVRTCPIHPYDLDVQGLPKGGITRVMAARIAEAVWYTQYGDRIIQCRPYNVAFSNGLWIVTATDQAEASVGNPYMEIDSKDGRIVRYILRK